MADALSATPKTAMAVGAHPDDIEFMMAGTLLMLRAAGFDIHMWSLANGSCGTLAHDCAGIIRARYEESLESAREAGAALHAPLVNDLEILYQPALVARVAAVLREVRPDIILLPSPDDYMEDHVNTSRLAVTAAFARGMPNFETSPPVGPWHGDPVLYHAMPYGLRDGLRRLVRPGMYVDVGGVIGKKRSMLEKHRSQSAWLDSSQGLGSHAEAMISMCGRVGKMSGRFEYAEGWRRHSHLGFSAEGADPLARALATACVIDDDYESALG